MIDLLRILFSFICGQSNCWVLGGVTLPFCQRCAGLYVGAFCALVLIAIFRPRPRAWIYWLHGVFMLAMFPFGFHLVPHGGLVRTFTGILFAFGLVYYLVLNLLSVRIGWRDSSRAHIGLYVSSIAALIALLLIAVRWGGATTAFLLVLLGTLGLAALVFLATANLLMLPGVVRSLLRGSAATTL